ncbi:family 35 glycosyl hydrolase [Plectosphaerella plurivora]|uniref:Beta-galactosidase n=1 Tax=Plectosphaerella plurivora TaxID=936078 RepID=A0A9P8V3K4_9PEZI|nr:family 35 glycosyl hydrolase [Plectosphaerella plurivora]
MLPLDFAAVVSALLGVAGASSQGGQQEDALHKRQQDIVTWDDKSVSINGERLMIFSAEIHAFRSPVPALWFDILQKVKAMGFNCVSFYVNWGLLEAKPGDFQAEGIFSLEPLIEAAKSAGVYLFARPGPYINAEVTGGGFPGWLQRVDGALRTGDPGYLEASENYTAAIGKIIADAQITNGGPVILFQQENEYVLAEEPYPFPDVDYWDHVKGQFKDAGITVPWVNNEAWQLGAITPTTPASVDIYGFDAYPLGFDCWNPTVWPENGLPTDWLARHRQITTTSPFTIVEFQGGGFQPWGGAGFDSCAALLNHEFQRVLYKNNYAMGITIFNVYMTWGGTNWGNLGHSDGYTSYDYGALLTEERLVNREKYSEAKLQAHFFQVSPAYLVADRHGPSLEWTNNKAITVTPATTNTTKFYISRHTDYRTTETVPYRLTFQTANHGNITVPQLEENLVLQRRDSKIHLSDYPVGDYNLLYSTAEVFTWKKYSDKTVLVLYGAVGEYHELAVESVDGGKVIEGPSLNIKVESDYTVVGWNVAEKRSVVQLGDLHVYLLDRNDAYNFWVPAEEGNFGSSNVIVSAGYLVRNVAVDGSTISFKADVNTTTTLEIVGGAPSQLEKLLFNGESLDFKQDDSGVVTATVEFDLPSIKLPCLSQLPWKYLDSLPEVQSNYSDDAWTAADLKETYNIANPLRTPVSLYGGDYGFHTGSLLFRGHFTAKEDSTTTVLNIFTQGGNAYGVSFFLGDTFLGSWIGNATLDEHNSTLQLPALEKGSDYVLTVVMDHMGMNGNWWVGAEEQKNPRGILNYSLAGYEQSDIKWKITGNLGGEDYIDRERGPLNEGGLFAERQGFHWPQPPSDSWTDSKGPTKGIDKAGIAFYSATFDLDLPKGYDIPISLTFANTTSPAHRAQIFVNGYQFGKFIPHVGPQFRFPVPEGVLNYQGENHLAITLWAMEEEGARVGGMKWEVGMVSASGFGEVEPAPQPAWKKRDGAY